MKKFILCSALFVSMFICSYAQEYHTALGVRWGKIHTGLSLKQMFGSDNSSGLQLELYRAYIYERGYSAKVFFIKQAQFRMPLLQIQLDYVLGGGIHAGYFPYVDDPVGRNRYGFRKAKKYHKYPVTSNFGYPAIISLNSKDVITVGIDLTAQIEYQIPMRDFPITVSIDANPFFEFYNPGPEYVDFGVTARYAFGYK